MIDSDFESRLASLAAGHSTEREFHALCELFQDASSVQRARVRRAVNVADGSWKVPLPATLADGSRAPAAAAARLRDALIWHAIEDGAGDWRDNLMSIVLIYHAAQRLGLDVDSLFDAAAVLASPQMAGILRGFPRRQPRDRTLEVFGYHEVATAGGVEYRAKA